ncbi:hypothetical protein BRC83_02570 [Halobacteriales archaeon QS_1_68_17]|nr:MAG: hypothetical protein BRC83_02570 [Halobacteriales archaeon QS_1_68_17]
MGPICLFVSPDRIVESVANRTDDDVKSLPPLYDAVDTDALGTVLDGTDVVVSFSYAGHVVTVDSRGTVDVDPLP